MIISTGLVFDKNQKSYVDFLCNNIKVQEIFFSLPNDTTARNIFYNNDQCSLIYFQNYLVKLKKNSKKLNLLLNSTIYSNEIDFNRLQSLVLDKLNILKKINCIPDVVTVISPIVAQIIKGKYKNIECRLSVINNISTQQSFEYCKDLFDSFYISPLMNRNLKYIKAIHDWCIKNNKKLGILVNSHCLADCPFHFSHYSYTSSTSSNLKNNITVDFNYCYTIFNDPKNAIYNILRGSWIRPDDLYRYNDICDIIKISNRSAINPEQIVKSYLLSKYHGNLIDILDCNMKTNCMIDNQLFPDDYFNNINLKCNRLCESCGYCRELANTFKT